jgi:O-antigen/teichoic acid export membrane protein
VFGEEVIGILLGQRWEESGKYAELLAPWLFTMFILAPGSAIFLVMRQQRLYFRLQIFRTLVAVAAFVIIKYQELSALDAVMLFSGVSGLVNLVILSVAYVLTLQKHETDKIIE